MSSGMPVPNPKSISKPEVVFWAILRMRGDKIAKTLLKRRFPAKSPRINVFGHAASEAEVHFETGRSILGVSAHAQ
jgi:hypothetical protein